MTDGAIAIVAGSGIDLLPLLDEKHAEYPFEEFPGLDHGRVPGHACRFIEGNCGRQRVILQCGRLHLYEGFSIGQVARPVQVLYDLGARTILFTNAVGGLLAGMAPGDLVAADLVRLWPYAGASFPETLTPDWQLTGCRFTGAYYWMHGPCYETRAEIAALRRLGGAAVGMSTAPELLCCQELGMRGALVSCVTNLCGSAETLTHQHVLEVAQAASAELVRVIRADLFPAGPE